MPINLGFTDAAGVHLGNEGAYTGAPAETHPYTAPYGFVDENSLWADQLLTDATDFRFVTPFQYITLDTAAAEAQVPPWGNDLNDYATTTGAYEGLDSTTIERKYSDGTLEQHTVEVNVVQGAGGGFYLDVGGGIGAKFLRNYIPGDPGSIPIGWEVGARHPKTGRVTRMYRTRDNPNG